MESFGLEQPLCDYNESMDGLTDLWDTNSFDSPMCDDLVRDADDDAYRQNVWSNCLNLGIITADVDADDALSSGPMVILRDRLITDAAVFDAKSGQTLEHSAVFFQTGKSGAVTGATCTAPVKTEHSYSTLLVGLRGDDLDVAAEMKPPVADCSDGRQEELDHVTIKMEPHTSSAGLTAAAESSTTDARNRPPVPRVKGATNNRLLLPRLNVQFDSGTGNFILPPTPPSSSSSDSEGSVSPTRDVVSPKAVDAQSPTCSTSAQDDPSAGRRMSSAPNSSGRLLSAKSSPDHSVNLLRHSINSPLISYQPKGSTGTLQLTEEEKRTLVAEGYPVPTRLPLTKAEEKSLKKIRRKIKNKISAQESRRKKKEYMDTLERRATVLEDENADYRHRLHQLESDNMTLQLQLKRLQQLLHQAGLNLNLSAESVGEHHSTPNLESDAMD